jgi:putative SOS response-associated peptidase YedK
MSLTAALMHAFDLGEEFNTIPRYNISPTDESLVLIERCGKREPVPMVFGLIPHWVKDPKIGLHCLNARSETITEKPAFRESLKKRRCLVMADGFYEWDRSGKTKIPYFIKMKSNGPFGMAGLWDVWRRSDGKEFKSFAVITTQANKTIGSIHDRMPVIIKKENYPLWLSEKEFESHKLIPLLKSQDDESLVMAQVSTAVNNTRNKSPECIQPV